MSDNFYLIMMSKWLNLKFCSFTSVNFLWWNKSTSFLLSSSREFFYKKWYDKIYQEALLNYRALDLSFAPRLRPIWIDLLLEVNNFGDEQFSIRKTFEIVPVVQLLSTWVTDFYTNWA